MSSSDVHHKDVPDVGVSGFDTIKTVVPTDHQCQLLQQCIILGVKVAVYVCRSETGVLYTAIVYFPVNWIALGLST